MNRICTFEVFDFKLLFKASFPTENLPFQNAWKDLYHSRLPYQHQYMYLDPGVDAHEIDQENAESLMPIDFNSEKNLSSKKL